MQNMLSHNLLLFCAPTWPSYHVIENLYSIFHWIEALLLFCSQLFVWFLRVLVLLQGLIQNFSERLGLGFWRGRGETDMLNYGIWIRRVRNWNLQHRKLLQEKWINRRKGSFSHASNQQATALSNFLVNKKYHSSGWYVTSFSTTSPLLTLFGQNNIRFVIDIFWLS